MKKALAFILILLIVAIPALAEGWDFASMTTDELIELRKLITDEINLRTKDDYIHIPEGKYIVGTDIDAGDYVFFWAEDYEVFGVGVGLYDSSDFEHDDYLEYHFFEYYGEEVRMKLSNGQCLFVEDSAGIDIRKAEKIVVP